MAFSPDGTTLASGGYAGAVKLWDVATRREIGTLTGHTADVRSVAFSPDGGSRSAEDGAWNRLFQTPHGPALADPLAMRAGFGDIGASGPGGSGRLGAPASDSSHTTLRQDCVPKWTRGVRPRHYEQGVADAFRAVGPLG